MHKGQTDGRWIINCSECSANRNPAYSCYWPHRQLFVDCVGFVLMSMIPSVSLQSTSFSCTYPQVSIYLQPKEYSWCLAVRHHKNTFSVYEVENCRRKSVPWTIKYFFIQLSMRPISPDGLLAPSLGSIPSMAIWRPRIFFIFFPAILLCLEVITVLASICC